MPRRAARVTQADLARAIRAAKQEGAGDVVLRPDGSIVIKAAPSAVDQTDAPIEAQNEIVL